MKTTKCKLDQQCFITEIFNSVGAKWSFIIINNLFNGKKRFTELKKMTLDLSANTLTTNLKKLEKNNIIKRKVIDTMPVTVEYSLTKKGKELKPIIDSMKLWNDKWNATK